MRELHLEYYQRVRQLVANATGAEHVVMTNVQLCALDEVRGSPATEAESGRSPSH